MSHTFFWLGSLFAGLSVFLGAFGAHALRARLGERRLENFETGVRYQMYHALALLATDYATFQKPAAVLPVYAGWFFVTGIILFSGSLYVLVLTDQRRWGAVTPLGGLLFLAGWLSLVLAFLV